MLRGPRHAQFPRRQSAGLYLAVLLTLILAACSSGVQRAPEIGLQQPQFDDPGEQAGSLTVELSDEARKEAADNLKFSQADLDKTIRHALEVNDLLAEQSDGALPTIEVTVTSVRVRSTFSAIMFGFMAGDDHIDGDVTIRSPNGGTLQQFSVSASYALGGLAGGQDSSRLGWLYEEFAERMTEELTGQSEEQLESSQTMRTVEPDGDLSGGAPASAETESAVESKMAAPEPQVATLPPASAPSGESPRTFDGEWILELQVEDAQNSTEVRVNKRVTISASRFSVPVEAGDYRGTIEGKIDRDGVLSVASELEGKPRWRGMLVYFSTSLRDGIFRASGPAKNLSHGQTAGDYVFVLSPVSQSAQ